MSVGGLANIEILNINLDKLTITTKEKTTESTFGFNDYYLTTFFVKKLELFIKEQLAINPDQKYLFGVWYHGFETPTTTNTFRRTLIDWKENANPHQFRDLINTLRDDILKDRDKCKILLNQAVKDVNAKHYLKKYKHYEGRIELYDESFPFNQVKIF